MYILAGKRMSLLTLVLHSLYTGKRRWEAIKLGDA